VSVHDVARACRLALEVDGLGGNVVNIGSGQSVSVNEIAERLAVALGKQHITADVTGKYRVGDIRHCFADISEASKLLGFCPEVALEDGMVELVEWLEGQVAVDAVDRATAELDARGLTV
jgi:dTDP-L-rhamnose 4-epimerase